MPTSAGSSESDRSVDTVSAARRPSTSATTTDTPAGHRRNNARCSAPRSCTRARLLARTSVGLAAAVAERADAVVGGRVRVARVRAGRRAFPVDVGRDAGPDHRRPVALALADRARAVREEPVAERTRAAVREEAVL